MYLTTCMREFVCVCFTTENLFATSIFRPKLIGMNNTVPLCPVISNRHEIRIFCTQQSNYYEENKLPLLLLHAVCLNVSCLFRLWKNRGIILFSINHKCKFYNLFLPNYLQTVFSFAN